MTQISHLEPERITQALAKFKTVSIGQLPTPLEPMPRLSQHCGGPMYIKRDDCTGLAFGGNKVRQLSYYLGDALTHGADTILITGAVQSNYVRCTAAAAARLGLACHIQLEDRVARADHAYKNSGNVLLNRLFGATVTHYPVGEDEDGADHSLELLADSYRARGKNPYVIHLSMGHTPFGALGYVEAAHELLEQLQQRSLSVDCIVVASGSGHTHAGLVTGLKLAGSNINVIGACVRRQAELQQPRVLSLCREVEKLLQCEALVSDVDIVTDDACLEPGYGRMSATTLEAMKAAARLEGIVVDPVYTAKSLACAMAVVKRECTGGSVLFLHTGGGPALFGYEGELTGAL